MIENGYNFRGRELETPTFTQSVGFQPRIITVPSFLPSFRVGRRPTGRPAIFFFRIWLSDRRPHLSGGGAGGTEAVARAKYLAQCLLHSFLPAAAAGGGVRNNGCPTRSLRSDSLHRIFSCKEPDPSPRSSDPRPTDAARGSLDSESCRHYEGRMLLEVGSLSWQRRRRSSLSLSLRLCRDNLHFPIRETRERRCGAAAAAGAPLHACPAAKTSLKHRGCAHTHTRGRGRVANTALFVCFCCDSRYSYHIPKFYIEIGLR